MANLILRYSLYTTNPKIDIEDIFQHLPDENLDSVYKMGETTGKYINKEHAIDYKYVFTDITSIEEICDYFNMVWSKYSNVLKIAFSNGVRSYLLFEFDIAGSDFPELNYKSSFLEFLGSIGAELQMYFYN